MKILALGLPVAVAASLAAFGIRTASVDPVSATVSPVSVAIGFDMLNTALVVTDPMVDFLSPEGVAWGMVGKNVTENDTVRRRIVRPRTR